MPHGDAIEMEEASAAHGARLESGPASSRSLHGALAKPATLFDTPSPSVGLVVATFAAVPYVHLHLESWRRYYPHIPLLVNDDGSPQRDRLRELCAEYGACFDSNDSRRRRTVGDMSAYVRGLEWIDARQIDILVKMSRRFLPCYNWVPKLQTLAWRSQMPTYSQCCRHFNFGFRTECIGFHGPTWRVSGGYDRMRELVERNEPTFVEGFVHQLAREAAAKHACGSAHEYLRQNPRKPEEDGYAVWDIMPDRRTTRIDRLLWHDCDGPFDYWRLATILGLTYSLQDFEDVNQGFGLGDP